MCADATSVAEQNEKVGGDLAETLTVLREQLLLAQIGGIDKDLRFEMQEIELELNMALAKSVDAKAGLKFWVISADAGGKLESSANQKLRLKMRLIDTRPQTDPPQETQTARISGEDRK